MNPPPPLPSPPLVTLLLFENPIPGVILFAALAGALWAWRKHRPWPSLVLLAACGLLVLLDRLVTTQRERVIGLTRGLVADVARADDRAVGLVLAVDASFRRRGASGEVLDREGILRRVGVDLAGVYKVREHSIREVQASIDGPNVARSRVRVRVVPELTGVPSTTWWLLDWRLDEGWRVRGITLESVEGLIDF